MPTDSSTTENASGTVSAAAATTAPPSRRLLALEALKIRNFRFLVASDFFGFIGLNTRMMVIGWVVLELTDSDGWVGLVAGLPAIPVIFLALFGGAITDRINRRTIQMWTFMLLASLSLTLGILVGLDKIQLWHIVVVAFPSALLATLRMTAGSAMVVDVVGRQLVFGANAASTAITNIARFAGPALGGWLLAKHGADMAFYFVFFSLTTGAIFLWFIRIENPVKADKSKSLLADFKLGITYIVGTPELRWLAVLALSILAAGISMPLVPRWARDVIGSEADGYAVILVGGGVGGLIGAIALMLAPPFKQLAKLLVVVAVVWSIAMVGFSFTTTLIPAAIAFGIQGGAVVWWANTIRTMFQLAARDDMRG
jgi:MFS family permease